METSKEAVAIVQVRNDGGLEEVLAVETVKSRYILKVESTGLAVVVSKKETRMALRTGT